MPNDVYRLLVRACGITALLALQLDAINQWKSTQKDTITVNNDNAEARKQRAKRLHKQIDNLIHKEGAAKDDAAEENVESSKKEENEEQENTEAKEQIPPKPISPREFIERKMKELDK